MMGKCTKMVGRRMLVANLANASWGGAAATKSRRLDSSSQAESVWNSSFRRSAASDQPTTPGAMFACLPILWLCAMKAGTVRRDFKKNREVNPKYSRSGSTSPICFHGGGGWNTGPSLDEQHVRLT